MTGDARFDHTRRWCLSCGRQPAEDVTPPPPYQPDARIPTLPPGVLRGESVRERGHRGRRREHQ